MDLRDTLTWQLSVRHILELLHADYEDWYRRKKLSANSIEVFAEETDCVRGIPELAGNIRKQGDRSLNVGLCGTVVFVWRCERGSGEDEVHGEVLYGSRSS